MSHPAAFPIVGPPVKCTFWFEMEGRTLFSFVLPTYLNRGTAILRKEELGHSFSKREIQFFIGNVLRSLFEVLRKIK